MEREVRSMKVFGEYFGQVLIFISTNKLVCECCCCCRCCCDCCCGCFPFVLFVSFVCLSLCVYIATRAELAELARALRSFRAGMVYVFPPFRTTKHENTRTTKHQQNTRIQRTRTTKHEHADNKSNKPREYRQQENADKENSV